MREDGVVHDETYIPEAVSQSQEDTEERRVEQEMEEEEEIEEEPLELVTRKQEPGEMTQPVFRGV